MANTHIHAKNVDTKTVDVMVFLNKDLIGLCGFSERTYYRKISALKSTAQIKFTLQGNYMTLEEAQTLADKLGFKKEFEQFLKQKS